MFSKGLEFYSEIGNRLKNLNTKKSFEHFLENKSYSYLDSNGEKIKLPFEKEREKRLFSKFINNMSNYKKLGEIKRNNYFSRLRGFKNSFEEKKMSEKRKKRFQEIINLKKAKKKSEGKLFLNYNDLQKDVDNILKEEKNNIRFNKTKDIIYRNKDHTNQNKLKSNSFNQKLFLSLNSPDSKNNNRKKFKFFDTNNSNIMPNIIRKRMHQNKTNFNLLSLKNEMNLFNSRLKKDETLKEIYPQILSQREKNSTNFNSNETNSFTLNQNLSNEIPNNTISNKNNKLRNLKFILNKNNNKIIQVNQVKIDIDKQLKMKQPLKYQNIRDSCIINFNHKEISKINSDVLLFSRIKSMNRNKNKMKHKKLTIVSNIMI